MLLRLELSGGRLLCGPTVALQAFGHVRPACARHQLFPPLVLLKEQQGYKSAKE